MRPTRIAARTLGLLAAIAGLACAAIGAPDRTLPEARDLGELMRDSLAKAEEAYFALIDGDIMAAQRPAGYLANNAWPEIVPKFWGVHIQAMQAGARRVANAFNVETATAGLGAMAAACGDCHLAVAPDISATCGSTEGPTDEPTAQMYRYQWAVDRMYEGLIKACDESWSAGARVAAERPSAAAAIAAALGDPTLMADVTRLEAAGTSAVGAERAQRGRVFGRYLAACGSCHSYGRHDLTRRPTSRLSP
jgi:cytochrome c553